jgi:glutaredoxin 3
MPVAIYQRGPDRDRCNQDPIMPEVVVYSSMFCPYCHRAKKLLSEKGVAFTEIEVTMDSKRRQEMMQRAGGRRSVPQIFIGETHVGGSDELIALERAGKLDLLLNGQPEARCG